MSHIKQTELLEIISLLPDIELLNVKSHLSEEKADLFLCALGFEDRALAIPELIAEEAGFKCNHAIYFEYATNMNDNKLNEPRLMKALNKFSGLVDRMDCDDHDFCINFKKVLERIVTERKAPKVIFDISTCSSKLLLLVLKVLFDHNLSLLILYSEADTYHPTQSEFRSEPEKWTTEEGFGLARGVGTVIASPEHPGYRRDKLQEMVIVFPTFKPERSKAVIADIDESLLLEPGERVIWIVGKPRLPENSWRVNVIREINRILPSAPSHEVSTFKYKETIEVLEHIYKPKDCLYHINLTPLGSKLQSVGIALFWYIDQDVSIIFATPKEYNAPQYSEGYKDMWQINFGELDSIRRLLDSVGQLVIVD